MSKYEDKIIAVLNKNHLSYEREKTFSDLKHGKFRFDFYILEGGRLIEVDGEQHFHLVRAFHKTRSDFLKTQAHDREKNSYCLANKISLYRIPYWEINNIKTSQDLFNKKFLVTTRWHNDNLVVPKK